MTTLTKAKNIAIKIAESLMPHCDLLHIAGSVRRGKQEVHDIEIVCLPKKVKKGGIDLFGTDNREVITDPDFVKTVIGLGKVIKGKPTGRMMQIEIINVHGGIKTIMLDLFMPQAEDYYRQLAIRTGPAKYSHLHIASRWLKLGWCGTSDGLRLQKECEGTVLPDGKMKWKCIVDNPSLPPVWQSEEEFFSWLGIQYLAPNYRTY